MTARELALRVLVRVAEEGAYADRAFRSEADRAGLDERDRSFAMQLAYGAVQRRRTLDHAIEAFARRPVRKLDPPVRAALQLGAYQLGFLRSVPVHAAVNETVELVRTGGPARAVPFTNAVMRRMTIGLHELLAALPETTPHEAALRHSYPDWVAELWWRELGPDEALALMRAQNDPPERAVRVNALRAAQLPGRPDPLLPDALVVDQIPAGWVEDGLAWPQSRGSQLAGLAVGVQAGERILDLCAAPGGKATQLAAAGAAEVVAVELHEGRARELAAMAARLEVGTMTVVCGDGTALPAHLTGFDRALVDAPCSGLGTLAARPDQRWRATPLPDLQRALLAAAVERVRPGGTITYAVCTVNAAENEGVVDAIGLPFDDLGAEWPAFRHPRRSELLLTLPHRHGTSGFFVARLRRP